MAVQARHVDAWVSEGIISQDQAESIREYEGRVTSSRGTTADVLGYVVASTAVVAAIIMVAGIWNDVGRGSLSYSPLPSQLARWRSVLAARVPCSRSSVSSHPPPTSPGSLQRSLDHR